MTHRQLHLNLFIYPDGHHEAAWRHPESEPERVLDLEYYAELALKAERATFDAIFLADGPALADNIRYASRFRIEPFTWLAALAAVTSRIGLIGTASTTYTEPYNLARLFAGLDHLSRGRAGWNIVTTGAPDAAQNFGQEEHPVHAARYARAEEFLDVVTKLWDSWEDEALVADPVSGLYADTDRIHSINHVGPHFSVRGPLNTPRIPQGRPVYVQAGSSEDGRAFAARHAEAIFTAHQTYENAAAFYRDIKHRVAAVGRNPDHVHVLPGISPFLGSTEAEARARQEELNELTQPEYSIDLLRRLIGIDLTGYDLNRPFPRELVSTDGELGLGSRFQVIVGIIDRERPTIRQLLHRLAGARGHWVVAGTPTQIADHIEHWFRHGAADGFNVMPPYLTGGFDAFADEVIPILRRRGVFRTSYDGFTLRDHYRLPRPDSQFRLAAVPVGAAP
jgi:FMN-dependent oxidoreductase (nitrilotriacetate monooxygenase family)